MNNIAHTIPINQVQQELRIRKKEIHTLLTHLTSKIFHGRDKGDGPIHRNTQERLLKYNSFHPWRISEYFDHIQGRDKIYFTGAHEGYALLMVDIDSHIAMNMQACWDAAHEISEPFPGICWEQSGRGVHGYMLVRYEGLSPEQMGGVYTHLSGYLRQITTPHPDISEIACKGKPGFFQYAKGRRVGIYSGTLAAFPKEASYEDLISSAYSAHDILALEVEARYKREDKHGSCSTFLGEEEFETLPGLLTTCLALASDHPIKQKGTHRAHAQDGAEWGMIEIWIKNNPNEDDTNPAARHEAIHRLLFKMGICEKQFHYERYQAIRDWFADLGAIKVEDAHYWPGENGEKGRACKWHFDLQIQGGILIPNEFSVGFRPIRLWPQEMVDYAKLQYAFDEWDRQQAA